MIQVKPKKSAFFWQWTYKGPLKGIKAKFRYFKFCSQMKDFIPKSYELLSYSK